MNYSLNILQTIILIETLYHTMSTINGSVGFGHANSNRSDVSNTQRFKDGCQFPYKSILLISFTDGGIFNKSRHIRPVLSIFG